MIALECSPYALGKEEAGGDSGERVEAALLLLTTG